MWKEAGRLTGRENQISPTRFLIAFFFYVIVLSFRLFVKAYRSITLLTKLRLPQNLEGSGVPEYRYCLLSIVLSEKAPGDHICVNTTKKAEHCPFEQGKEKNKKNCS